MPDYGYKICYKKQGKEKLKVYLITASYDLALYHVRWYENHSPPDSKTHTPLTRVNWEILPIKTYLEYKFLWKGCPF